MNAKILRLAMLVALFLFVLARGAAEQPNTITFRFVPPNKATSNEKARLTIVTSVRDMSFSVGIDGTAHTDITSLENDEFRYSKKIDSMEVTQDGSSETAVMGNMLGSLLLGYAMKDYFSPEGKLVRVEGAEELRRNLTADLPREMVPFITEGITDEILFKERNLEWQNRVGRFIGRTVKVGDLWLDTTSMPFFGAAGGMPFPVYRSTRIIGWEKNETCDALLINVIYHASPDGLARAINRPVAEVKAAGPAKPAAPPKGLTLYTVENLIVDPTTMHVFSESREMRISMVITDPSGAKFTVYSKTTEDHKYTYPR